jgi:Domain of unknown function (DUF4387)
MQAIWRENGSLVNRALIGERMRELWQFTKLIRSKNAGPFELTFDIMFKNHDNFNDVLKSESLSPKVIAQLYRVDVEQVSFFVVEQLLAIKISIPRRVFSGDVRDTDIYGGQFHGPLVRLPIKE